MFSSYLALEAFSCGTPVVLILERMNTDYLPDNCSIQVNSTDVQELRKAFTQATKKSRRDCRNYVIDKFNYKKMIENYTGFYNRVL